MKCKVMSLGVNNVFCYKLGAHQLKIQKKKKDLNVLVDLKIISSCQCDVVVKKATSPDKSFEVFTLGTGKYSCHCRQHW